MRAAQKPGRFKMNRRQIGTGNNATESKHRNRQQQPSHAKRDHQEPGQTVEPPNPSTPLI